MLKKLFEKIFGKRCACNVKTACDHVNKISKKVKEDAEVIAIKELSKDLDRLGNWLADVDEDLKQLSDLVERIAKRMGLYE